jgi:hypothetical protein
MKLTTRTPRPALGVVRSTTNFDKMVAEASAELTLPRNARAAETYYNERFTQEASQVGRRGAEAALLAATGLFAVRQQSGRREGVRERSAQGAHGETIRSSFNKQRPSEPAFRPMPRPSCAKTGEEGTCRGEGQAHRHLENATIFLIRPGATRASLPSLV